MGLTYNIEFLLTPSKSKYDRIISRQTASMRLSAHAPDYRHTEIYICDNSLLQTFAAFDLDLQPPPPA